MLIGPYKNIRVARNKSTFKDFNEKLCQKYFEIRNVNLSGIESCNFPGKIFPDWNVRAVYI